jgi:hypothetical protein
MLRQMKMHTIEVDETTATTLKTRAAERGVSVSELVAELVALGSEPVALDTSEIAELDRRWKAIEGGSATVSNSEVVRWLETWGTPAFRHWHERLSSNGRMKHLPTWTDSRLSWSSSIPRLPKSWAKRLSPRREFCRSIHARACD